MLINFFRGNVAMIEDDDPYRPEDVSRYICAYDKEPDKDGYRRWAADYEFYKPVSLKFLQKLFGIDPNYPDGSVRYMFDCYHIDAKKAKVLQSFVKEKLDLEKYNFKLECSDKESHEKNKARAGRPFSEEELMRFIVAEELVFLEGSIEKRLTFQKPVSLEFLCKLFHLESDELGWVEIEDKKIAGALQPFIAEPFDFSKYNYVLRCTTKESYEAWKKEDNVP